jgi:pimeloyl-ACP methyl ester carboxylesterase
MTGDGRTATLQVCEGVAVWLGGSGKSDIDVWFLHAFADSHLCFRDAFGYLTSDRIRIVLLDLPGHGASPPRADGLTIETAARTIVNLIGRISSSRAVVLVAHSMAALIATRAARLLGVLPTLVISVEGNLTSADAYLSGHAAGFDDAGTFASSFRSRIRELAKHDEAARRFACSVEFADPKTLWTLGRSIARCPDPGADFLSLKCPRIYYWDPGSTTPDTQSFLARHDVRQRITRRVGHWPMTTAPAQFYGAVERDVLPASDSSIPDRSAR